MQTQLKVKKTLKKSLELEIGRKKIENYESNLLLFLREADGVFFFDHPEKHKMVSKVDIVSKCLVLT